MTEGLKTLKSDASFFQGHKFRHHLGWKQKPHKSLILLRDKLQVVHIGFAILLIALYSLDQLLLCQLFVFFERLDLAWLDLLKRQQLPDPDGLLTHKTLAVVDFPKPYAGLLLGLVSRDPDSRVNVKFVIGQEHPPKLAHELQSPQNVVNLCLCLEIV